METTTKSILCFATFLLLAATIIAQDYVDLEGMERRNDQRNEQSDQPVMCRRCINENSCRTVQSCATTGNDRTCRRCDDEEEDCVPVRKCGDGEQQEDE